MKTPLFMFMSIAAVSSVPSETAPEKVIGLIALLTASRRVLLRFPEPLQSKIASYPTLIG